MWFWFFYFLFLIGTDLGGVDFLDTEVDIVTGANLVGDRVVLCRRMKKITYTRAIGIIFSFFPPIYIFFF
ncbi:MAG: hypothetical protein CM15mP83_5340 [Flavobacteriaceae bacterium]|nr:MAG: hypothetical protein CM15mP83_5340 [Flavobacteriaceae bacterium]